ncbi:hypothetical protein IV500_17520 [Paeniglutamicibacter antarcticus]|uniref:Uncharacterized protein n=1 Tax=Arthrobacter terrae TaxID=2935737 RepID=A0A931CS18_9MICC|nr:hypothetical protein [Arthrobacter terrae]MBG0741171.1 hypothetical protein [Arthrobacter terrae]
MKADRSQVENRIRAAIQTLLADEIPPGMNRDITSLCALAGVPRATVYRTYPHLKAIFEEQRSHQQDTATNTDAETHQKIPFEKDRLQLKLTAMTTKVHELEHFKSTALSRLAAQHEEILRLRSHHTTDDNVQSIW